MWLLQSSPDDGRTEYGDREALALLHQQLLCQCLGVGVGVGPVLEEGRGEGLELVIVHPSSHGGGEVQ